MPETGGQQFSNGAQNESFLRLPPDTTPPTPPENPDTAAPETEAERQLREQRAALRTQATELLDRLNDMRDQVDGFMATTDAQRAQQTRLRQAIARESGNVQTALERIDAMNGQQLTLLQERLNQTATDIDALDHEGFNDEAEENPEGQEQGETTAELTDETPPPPTPEEQERIGRILGCLAPETAREADAELNMRIQRELENMGERTYELHEDLVNAIAAEIMASWEDEQRAAYAGRGREVVQMRVAELTGPGGNEAARRQFDELVRKTVTKYLIGLRTRDVRAKIEAHLAKLQQQQPDSKAVGFLKKASGFFGRGALLVGGVAGGALLRQTFIQWGMPAAARIVGNIGPVNAARTLSGLSGVAAGAIVGGTIGGVTGFLRAKNETYLASNIRNEINKLQDQLGRDSLTPDEEAGLLVRLIDQKKLRGTPEEVQKELTEVLAALDRYYEIETREELEGAIAAVEANPLTERFSHEQNLARALTALNYERLNGSVKHRTELFDKFVAARRNEVSWKTFKSAGWGALQGALPAGILGALFPSPQMIAGINAEHAVQEVMKQGKAGLEPLIDALRAGKAETARHLAHNFNINLGANYHGHSLYEAAREVVSQTHGENQVRALHHILSHPGATVDHVGQIIDLANKVPDGRAFSDIVLNGWANGTNGKEVADSLYAYFQKHKQFPIGSREGWEHLIGFAFTAWSAAAANRWGAGRAEGLNVAAAKERQELVEQKKEKESEEYRPGSRPIQTDKRIFDLERFKTEDPALYETLRGRLAEFKKIIPSHHGYFVVVKDGNKTKAFRLWPYNNHRARQAREANIHDSRDQNMVGDTGQPDLDLLGTGTIMVKEYNLQDLLQPAAADGSFPKHPMEKQLLQSWDLPQWHTPRTRIGLKADKLFMPKGDFLLEQALISPTDIGKYAYAIQNGLLKPGQYVKNIDAHVKRMIEEGRLQPNPEGNTPGTPTPEPATDADEKTILGDDTEADEDDEETPEEPEDRETPDDGTADEPTSDNVDRSGAGSATDPAGGNTRTEPSTSPATPEPGPAPAPEGPTPPTPENPAPAPTTPTVISGPFGGTAELQQLLTETKDQPPETRRARLEQYRQRALANKEELAELHTQLVDEVRREPDMAAADVDRMIDNYEITDEQKAAFRRAFETYADRHAQIEWLRQTYSDPADLYDALFGRRPKGQVTLVESPISLYFRLEDPRDVARIWTGNYTKENYFERETADTVDRAHAFIIGNTFKANRIKREHPGHEMIADRSIIIENATALRHGFQARGYNSYKDCSAAVLAHEEQHALNGLFAETVADTEAQTEWAAIQDPAAPGTEDEKNEKRRMAIRHYLRAYRRREVESRAKDELLAMIRIENDVQTPDTWYRHLTTPDSADGSYDYAAKHNMRRRSLDRIVRDLPGVGAYQSMIDQEYDRLFSLQERNAAGQVNEYPAVIRRAVDAYTALRDANYDQARVINMLAHEPLDRWATLARRLTGQRGPAPTP